MLSSRMLSRTSVGVRCVSATTTATTSTAAVLSACCALPISSISNFSMKSPTPLASSTSSFSSLSFSPKMINTQRFTSDDAAAAAGKKEDAGAEADESSKKAIAALQEEVDKLKVDLKKKTEEAQDLKNKVLYNAAEAENARRIGREDTQKAQNFAIRSFAVDMLEINDTLERALEAFGKLHPDEVKFLTDHKHFSSLVTGVKLSHSQMKHNLGRHGVEDIEANAGEKFDPHKHDAVFNAPESDIAKDGEIAAVVKKGYMLKDRVLRATTVGVAQKQ